MYVDVQYSVTTHCVQLINWEIGSHLIFRQMVRVFMQHSGVCKTEIIDANQTKSIKMKLLICSANMLMVNSHCL